MKKIWIVEDDPAIAGQLEKHLRSWNYDTRCAVDFQHITAEFTSFSPAGSCAAVWQRISLVCGNPPDIKCSGDLYLLGGRSDEYGAGHEHGRR